MVIATLDASAVAAQDRTDLAVMRDTSAGVPRELADALDAALLQALADVAGIRSPFVSPVDYAEVQLTVGCSDESAPCLTAVAQTAEARAVVIRRLVTEQSGTVRLHLVYFDEATGRPPTHAEISAAEPGQEPLTQAMPAAVRHLLGHAETRAGTPSFAQEVDRTAPAPRAPREDASLAPVAWITLGAGAALLAPGIALALSADADYDEFRRMEIRTRADADRARADFDSIETRATWSSVLIPAGALALGAGGVLLGIHLTAGDDTKDNGGTQAFVAPLDRGGILVLRGSLDRTH